MESPAPRKARRFGAVAVALVMGAGLIGVLAPSALAQDDSTDNNNGSANEQPHHPRLTDAQRACLTEHGATLPQRGDNGERPELTDAQKTALRAAAQACGIELGHPHPQLTDAQRTCLQEHGVQKPQPDENGSRQRPTDEQRAAFRAAAKACGIDLPDRPPSGGNDAT